MKPALPRIMWRAESDHVYTSRIKATFFESESPIPVLVTDLSPARTVAQELAAFRAFCKHLSPGAVEEMKLNLARYFALAGYPINCLTLACGATSALGIVGRKHKSE